MSLFASEIQGYLQSTTTYDEIFERALPGELFFCLDLLFLYHQSDRINQTTGEKP